MPEALHTLGALFDLADQTDPHRFPEVDVADQPGQVHSRPQQIPVVASIAPLLALGNRPEPLLAAPHIEASFPNRLDLRLDVTGAAVDRRRRPLVVGEDHQIPDRAFPVAQPRAHPHDCSGDGRCARDRPEDRLLRPLEPCGDLDLALAGEQRHRPHLTQLQPDHVIGLIDCTRRQVLPDVVQAGRAPVAPLVSQVLRLRVDHLLAGVLARPACADVRYLEATVTSSNDASWALFRSVALDRLAGFDHQTVFDPGTSVTTVMTPKSLRGPSGKGVGRN